MAIVPVAAVVIGLLVVAALGAVVVMLVRTERLVKSAVPRLAAMSCPRCGVAIGAGPAATVAASRAEEMRLRFEEARAKGVMLRVDSKWHFPCPACGAALKFAPGDARDALSDA